MLVKIALVLTLLGGTQLSPSASFAETGNLVGISNCTELRRLHAHGVGMPNATDSVRGQTQPVTIFERNATLYQANSHLDRDADNIACEKV